MFSFHTKFENGAESANIGLQRTAAIAAHPIARLGSKGNGLQLYRARPSAAAEAGC